MTNCVYQFLITSDSIFPKVPDDVLRMISPVFVVTSLPYAHFFFFPPWKEKWMSAVCFALSPLR